MNLNPDETRKQLHADLQKRIEGLMRPEPGQLLVRIEHLDGSIHTLEGELKEIEAMSGGRQLALGRTHLEDAIHRLKKERSECWGQHARLVEAAADAAENDG